MKEPKIELVHVAAHRSLWHVTLIRGENAQIYFCQSSSHALVVIGRLMEELKPRGEMVQA